MNFSDFRNRLPDRAKTMIGIAVSFSLILAVLFLDRSGVANRPIGGDSSSPTSEVGWGTEAFSFAVLGDTQTFYLPESRHGFVKAMRLIDESDARFVMTVGDLIQGCDQVSECADAYVQWEEVAESTGLRTYRVMGNHDRQLGFDSDDLWLSLFGPMENGPTGYEEAVYSFDFANAHFIVLNSEKPVSHIIDATQRAWLEEDLKRNTREHTFVFFHQPAFPVSYSPGSGLDYREKERDALWEILDRFGVDAVFNGHEHVYSRKRIGQEAFPPARSAVYQIIAGNTDAGEREAEPGDERAEVVYQGYDFLMVSVRGAEARVTAYDMSGGVVDTFPLE